MTHRIKSMTRKQAELPNSGEQKLKRTFGSRSSLRHSSLPWLQVMRNLTAFSVFIDGGWAGVLV